jgi:hypothetical protein
MSCCRFPSFPAGSFVAFWNPKNPPAALLLLVNPPNSAVLVEFHNHKDSVMRAAEILRAPIMRSRDILHQAEGDHLDQVHSDQMVLEMIRWRRMVR